MMWAMGYAVLSILASLFAWSLVRINKGEDYEGYDKLEAALAPGPPVRSWLWDILGLLCAMALAAWAIYSVINDAHGQTLPTPIQPQGHAPYVEEQGPPKPKPAPARPQRHVERPATVECWNAFVTPESFTIQCNTGYWMTYMADGTVVSGNGITDPNARAGGSTIVINPVTGGPTGQVTAPSQMPMEAPHQAPMWGQYPLQTR